MIVTYRLNPIAQTQINRPCPNCRAEYDRLANAASGVLTDPWAGQWNRIVAECGCTRQP